VGLIIASRNYGTIPKALEDADSGSFGLYSSHFKVLTLTSHFIFRFYLTLPLGHSLYFLFIHLSV